MNYSLVLQSNNKNLDIALCVKAEIISLTSIPHNTLSTTLVLTMASLLEKQGIQLSDCAYIATNQGPAPFTALRTILATVNGIQAAQGISLVGVDSLQGLITLYACNTSFCTIALLNAFNEELYFSINESHQNALTGYDTLDHMVQRIQTIATHMQVMIIGNGLELILKKYPDFLNNPLIKGNKNSMQCTVADIASLSYKAYTHNHLSFNVPLYPLYLKKHAVERV